MKKLFISLICLVALFNATAQSQKKEKVILDADMVEVFDDGISMLMLAQAPNIDLLGVTIVVGNTWVPEGTAYAIRQLEAIGRTDIPVVEGARFPLYPNRHDIIKAEKTIFGLGDGYLGSAGYPEPSSWKSVYLEKYGSQPTVEPIDMKAVNFIIDQVKKNPNEITFIAIGTCTNLAIAVRIAPEIIPLIKKVVYMGGSFFKPGNTSTTAEFNWWLDPDAAKICLHTPFKEQIIVSLDVCETMPFTKNHYDNIIEMTQNSELKKMFTRNFLNKLFTSNPDYVHYIWDVIAAAIVIDPSLAKEDVIRSVDINSQYGFSYGQSLAYDTNPPLGSQKARIILKVDESRLWKLVEDNITNF